MRGEHGARFCSEVPRTLICDAPVDLAAQVAVGTREFVRHVLERLEARGDLRPGLRLDVETERLSSLVDGLAMNAVLRPELVSGPACLEVVRTHLGALAA
ncbi:TetR family transcriptional regulator C-terminal domain-containing protein [Nonomuraea sp. NPDC000554]|uniref:TetR family transcriptional regulator C-terminal domain-containing protein n=1 Tax=Nonomuraea sp. NPDC000554 TaxID=3154259 RepID=UPI00331CE256